MKKPFKLVSNSKRKKPVVLGRYSTLVSAEKAKKIAQRKNDKSRDLMRKYPNGYIEDLFCDLKIIGPEDE